MNTRQTSYYDEQFNLLYCFVAPQGEKSEGFLSKISSLSGDNWAGYSNIVLWDIPKKQKFSIFKDKELAEGETVSGLLFESSYDAANKKFVYNSDSHVMNNRPLAPREPIAKLLISTHNSKKKETSLWMSDKWGLDKFKIATFSDQSDWHLDTMNAEIRIITWLNNDVQVLELRWYL